MPETREYKKSAYGQHRYLTFRPIERVCELLDEEAQKRQITVSALLRQIVSKHYEKKEE